jgi:tripeptidyl-peptidase I
MELCGEGNLDLQYLMAVSQTSPTVYWFVPPTSNSYVSWLRSFTDKPNPPVVISISWSQDEYYLSSSYANQFNIEAMKLGLQGITLIASSGDDGVAGNVARADPMLCRYNPQFPASSPYVTAVGGTMGPESGQPEVGCQSNLGGVRHVYISIFLFYVSSLKVELMLVMPCLCCFSIHKVITSGGGFSGIYPAPSWQKQALATYQKQQDRSVQGFNPGGRGYPDLAALAYNYEVIINGSVTYQSGTSASSPVIAGIVALANAAREQVGRGTLGWLNPAIYHDLSATFFNDVLSGDNKCVAQGDYRLHDVSVHYFYL